jgi:hypothetical protein
MPLHLGSAFEGALSRTLQPDAKPEVQRPALVSVVSRSFNGCVSSESPRIEEGTQQNAALVEQTSAAAESLRKQAELLVEAVARFRLA